MGSRTLETHAEHDDVVRQLGQCVDGLVELDRRTGTSGEQQSAAWIAARLRTLGVSDVQEQSFKTASSWVPIHLAHLLAAIGVSAMPGGLARTANGLLGLSYELEVSGRCTWLRRFMPSRYGTTVTGYLPALGVARQTLVLVAHHDAAHTGLLWHPAAVAVSRSWARRTGRALPSHGLPLLGMLALTRSSRRVRTLTRVLLGGLGLLMVQSERSATTPGANDNASGVAVAIETTRYLLAHPLPNTDVLLVFPGGEEAGNYGMKAWLAENAHTLDPGGTLVVNLDAVGGPGTLSVSQRESLTGILRPEDVALALAAAACEQVDLQPVGITNATDAIAASHAGLPTISLVSINDGWISNLHRPSDTADALDWNTMLDAVRLTRRIAQHWSTRKDAA